MAHGLTLVPHHAGGQPDFQHARAALFWGADGDGAFSTAMTCLNEFVQTALNHGLYVVVVVPGDIDDGLLNAAKKELKKNDPWAALESNYRVLTTPVKLHHVLHQVLVHAPGPSRRLNLSFVGDVLPAAHTRFLFERAFHDCTSLTFEPIAPGKSGADTFIVKATLEASNAGPEPVPFFAKLGRPDKLRKEWDAFRIFAEHHVPWYLRPNFVPEKTTYGVDRALLVGTFVQNSCSLAEAVRNGGERHIKSLFVETLGALRQQLRTIAPGKVSVVSALETFCWYDEVPATRWNAAAVSFGGEAVPPARLWWRLMGLPALDWRRSAIHGDLHGENVRVRKEDAIVIDIAHACTGPASADLAHLEVSLLFDGHAGDVQGEDWKKQVGPLYAPAAVEASYADPGTVPVGTWMHAAVRQVRGLVKDAALSSEEYMRVLSVYLLRQAALPVDTNDAANDEYRRRFAYWLACQLTIYLEAKASATLASA
jgi:hypothetical protein